MLSIVVFTKNEQEQIGRCLKLLGFGDELIMIDNRSTDQTIEIAKKFGAKIIQSDLTSFAQRHNLATDRVNGDWMLYVDADERVTKKLQQEIKEVIREDRYSAFAIPRENILLGRLQKKGGFWPDYQTRLIKKSSLDSWVGEVHESPQINGRVGKLTNPLLHLSHRNVDSMMFKSLAWSKIEAELIYQTNHPRINGIRLLWVFIRGVFNRIRLGELREGTEGWIEAMMFGISKFLTYVRVWELQKEKPLQQLYQELDEKILKDNS